MYTENNTTEEAFVSALKSAVDAVKTDADLDELNRLKKLFKQTVPFNLRSYVGAYLAKQLCSRGSRKNYSGRQFPHRTQNEFPRSGGFAGNTPRQESPRRAMIEDGEGTTIFISIGRNKRVFVKELVSLLVHTAGIERERIGLIKVLNNYSFVQLFADDAETAISRLNGLEYRGRNLLVSYSRKKEAFDEAAGIDTDELTDADDKTLAAAAGAQELPPDAANAEAESSADAAAEPDAHAESEAASESSKFLI